MEKVRRPSIAQADTRFKTIDSPVGPITFVASREALLSLQWGTELLDSLPTPFPDDEKNPHPILAWTEAQLTEYFQGLRKVFDVPLAPSGTEFQRDAWRELRKIPYGQTITYGEQARRLGQPKSARAVGAANRRNPIGIIIPCHRVIGASGDLTGFAGGLEAKRRLLELEGIKFVSRRNVKC